MTMRPPACCPEGAEPLLLMQDYVPSGEMVTVGENLPCYVARPSGSCTSAIVMFTDMFGVHTGRHKQLCDELALEGFLVICPDFFYGAPYMKKVPSYGITLGCFCQFFCLVICKSFEKKTRIHGWDVSLRAKVEGQVVPWLRSQGAQKLASVGFCWGSYGAMKSCTLADFSCGISFHPSVDGFCKATGEDDLAVCRDIKCPHVVVVTKNEPDRWKPGGAAQAACEEVTPCKVSFKLEAEMQHGFMTRGDTKKKPEVLDAIKRGMQDMITLFKANAM